MARARSPQMKRFAQSLSPSGTLDPIQPPAVTGWALRDPRDADPSYVVVQIDRVLFAPIKADQYRQETAADTRLPREGYVGFTFEIPDRFADGQAHTLRAFTAGTNTELLGSPCEFRFQPADRAGSAHRARQFSEETVILESFLDSKDQFAATLKRSRGLALCASYFEQPRYGLHHLGLFDLLRQIGFAIVNVHALGSTVLLDPHCGGRIDYSILKVNKGYDFGSWQVAVAKTWEFWPEVGQIIFVNDSCIGPLAPNRSTLIDFIEAQHGIFGLTDSYDHQYHIQSYFFGVGTDVESRNVLSDFFLSLAPAVDRTEAITHGELALGSKMAEHDVPCNILCPYDRVLNTWLADLRAHVQRISDLVPLAGEQLLTALTSGYEKIVRDLSDGLPMNPCHVFWHTLVRAFGHPFIKRELLFKNPTQVPDQILIMRYLAETCANTYDQALALAKSRSAPSFPVIL